ncbi:hypothetical protein QR680_010025 [Steinernema hermaphroditum]|uniref:NTR domain-containing protein n=1 Tax=Steinernema hermaphroditum TaxID=289476 RepID=A0AA39IMG4_9BILA|nr:hypothetical protein QR680_010025 [Steinernema hermaphroditum]
MYRTLLLFASVIAVALACSCRTQPKTPKEKFCDSTFVATFTVWGKDGNDTHIFYTTVADKVFKTNLLIQSGSHIRVITNSQKEACGVTWLESGKKYLLNGNRVISGMGISTCEAISATEWSNVPADVKKSLNRGSYLPCPDKN